MMECTAAEALKNVGTIITEINENNSKEALAALQAATAKKESNTDDDEVEEVDSRWKRKAKATKKGSSCCEPHGLPVHVTVLLTAVALLALSALHIKNV